MRGNTRLRSRLRSNLGAAVEPGGGFTHRSRMEITQNQKVIAGIVGLLLIASVLGNVLLLGKLRANEQLYAAGNVSTSSGIFSGPGFKNEVVTVFDGEQYRTYATSSPLSESDIRSMREEMQKEFERMDEFFRRQDELFRSLWRI